MVHEPRVAWPLASVVRSVPVSSSPCESASNVTGTPARALPKASVTLTTGRMPAAWPTTTNWNASLTAVTTGDRDSGRVVASGGVPAAARHGPEREPERRSSEGGQTDGHRGGPEVMRISQASVGRRLRQSISLILVTIVIPFQSQGAGE